jgi:hypothetical protein
MGKTGRFKERTMRLLKVFLQQTIAVCIVVPLLVVVMACVPFYAVWACCVDDDGGNNES